jgi:tetratricopeptide (TPR) repeat protein
MTTIALCMIVRNEVVFLPRCLEAAAPWVDELVVVDTGSTDGTQELARSRGARVVEWAWRDDFAAARNESLRHARAEWILILDADEFLTEGSGPALRRACAEAAADVVAYEIKIVCPREGDGGLVRLNWFPRLFKNLPGVAFEGVIHEQVVGSLVGRGRVARAPVEAQHAGYTLSAEQMAVKARRNLTLLKKQLRQDPKYAPGWFQIAETYVLLDRLDEAVDAYRRCLALLDTSRLTLPPGVVAVALQNLGAALFARGDDTEGTASLRAALEIEPHLVPAYVHLGRHALTRGDCVAAERHFSDALAAAERGAEVNEYAVTPWLVHFLRGAAQGRQNKFTEALASFQAALALHPKHADTLWLFALTAANCQRWAESLDALDQLQALGRSDFSLHAQRAVVLAELSRFAEAADTADIALDLEPEAAAVLGLAARCRLSSGQADPAAVLYERLAALTPEATAPLLALAQCRESLGDHAGMMAAYRRAVAIAPGSADVLFALGSACLRIGALEPAVECLASAVEQAPERPDYLLNLALCRLKAGDVAEARRLSGTVRRQWPAFKPGRDLEALIDRVPALSLAAAGAGR